MQWNPDTPLTVTMPETTPNRSRIRLPVEELTRWLEQLATLLSAGISLPDCLQAQLRAATGKHWPRLLTHLQEQLAMGLSLSEAMAEHPRVFDPFALALIRTGERTGRLELAVQRLADSLEARLRMRRQLQQIMTYPLVVLVVSLLISGFLLGFVVPQFAGLFRDSGSQLPWLTEQLLHASDLVRSHWQWLPLAVVPVFFVLRAALRADHAPLRRALARLPVLGTLWRQMAAARWATTMALTTRVGLPILEGLSLAADNAGHPVFSQHRAAWLEGVRSGRRLAEVLAEAPLPPWALQMIAAGQESGALDRMLERCAEILNDEVERRVKRLQTLLEPAVMLIIGAVVGVLLLAMYMPIFRLASTFG